MAEDSAPAAASTLSFWRFFIQAYAFVLLVAICGVIPGCNFMYSGHGGIFWLLLPLGLPYALLRTGLWWYRARGDTRQLYAGHAVGALILYLLLAIPISALAAYSIEHTFGLPVKMWQFYAVMVVPFSLPLLLVS
jgi:hypothetical protein